jgi:hypothetical protein
MKCISFNSQPLEYCPAALTLQLAEASCCVAGTSRILVSLINTVVAAGARGSIRTKWVPFGVLSGSKVRLRLTVKRLNKAPKVPRLRVGLLAESACFSSRFVGFSLNIRVRLEKNAIGCYSFIRING